MGIDEDDEHIPGLHDLPSIPMDERVAKFKAYLRDWVDLELAIEIAASAHFLLREIQEQSSTRALKRENTVRILDKAIDALETYRKNEADRKKQLSTAGARGANAKHQDIRQLKKWALKEASSRRGDDKTIARYLAKHLPKGLDCASKDPARLIYDALRVRKKP